MKYPRFSDEIHKEIKKHFLKIYGEEQLEFCLDETHQLLEKYNLQPVDEPIDFKNVWTHKDQILITYGDMVQPEDGEPVPNLANSTSS